MLLATVCAAKDAVPGTDFMPLQVEYREKFAAAGRFPGGFTKREGKASDYEILTCRLVDRALRPLVPQQLSRRSLCECDFVFCRWRGHAGCIGRFCRIRCIGSFRYTV